MNDMEIYGPQHTMRSLIRDNNLLLMTLSRFNIAFGFGEKTVAEICRDNAVDEDTFLAVCNFLSGRPFGGFNISLPALIAYLRRAHSSFLDFSLAKIRHNLIDAINYSEANDVAMLLIKFYDDYVVEARNHIDYENNVIFNYAEKLIAGYTDTKYSIEEFNGHHTHMASKLRDLKDVFISHYHQKDNTRLSAVLFDIIVCEKDFISHYEIERQLLVPAIEKLEDKSVKRTEVKAPEDTVDKQTAILGSREKDIIRLVAKGLANKEIADKLCLSFHTVTTHRRNISTKLNIHSAAGLTVFAILNHLVELDEVKPQ